jgi:hypothetical protein
MLHVKTFLEGVIMMKDNRHEDPILLSSFFKCGRAEISDYHNSYCIVLIASSTLFKSSSFEISFRIIISFFVNLEYFCVLKSS